MNTYSQKQGKTPFDWRAFLNQSEISDASAKWAESQAKEWVTCACGNQCDIIPRTGSGAPRDAILNQLGGDEGFYAAVSKKDWAEAINFLDMIEVRSAYLIKKEIENIRTKVIQTIKLARSIGIEVDTLVK
jgi:hypothetical protein